MFDTFKNWEMDRCGKLTASEIHKLLGKSRKGDYFSEAAQTYIKQKAAEILTMELINGGRSNMAAMEWGNSHEQLAMDRFEKETGLQVEYFGGANPKFFERTPFSGGSPDGLTDDSVVEIKCPFNSTEHLQHLLLKDVIDLKDYYPEAYWQIVFNSVCCDKTHGYFISYDERYADEVLQCKIIAFDIDKDDAAMIVERVNKAEEMLADIISQVRKIV